MARRPHIAFKPRKRSLSAQQRKFATPQANYRSGLEEKIAAQLTLAGVPVKFETVKLDYVIPEKGHKYTPDFLLPNGTFIETKGIFATEDRQKMVLVKAQHPGLDIRFVFSNAFACIAKQSKTTYAKWADSHGFKWANKVIPNEWLQECTLCN